MIDTSTAGLGHRDSSHWRSYRLWSLWDMLSFNAGAFYAATRTLEIVRAIFTERAVGTEGGLIPVFIRELRELNDSLKTLGADLTLMQSDRIIEKLSRKDIKIEAWNKSFILEDFNNLNSRLEDELKKTQVFVLEREKHAYYEPKEPLFGQEVHSKFPSAIYEIDEAAKCYALERSTACVFHLMRLMEIGIKAAALCLGVPDPVKDKDRNWGAILGKIDAAIKAKGPKSNWAQPSDKAFFEEIYVSLDAVRQAWRNTTMHVETKQTGEEAEHIYRSVRAFM